MTPTEKAVISAALSYMDAPTLEGWERLKSAVHDLRDCAADRHAKKIAAVLRRSRRKGAKGRHGPPRETPCD
jgi:hypothetical protein